MPVIRRNKFSLFQVSNRQGDRRAVSAAQPPCKCRRLPSPAKFTLLPVAGRENFYPTDRQVPAARDRSGRGMAATTGA